MNGPNRSFGPPCALFLHPGITGEYAVVRFTAPADGTYKVSGRFFALDANGSGTTTDVWVLPRNQKGNAVTGVIDNFRGTFSFTTQVLELKSGDTLDFEVGYGADKNYEYDSTGLAALIEKSK